MKKIIITGSHGRVGAALVAGLKNKYEIYEINRSGEPSKTYFLADVADFARLKQVMKEIGSAEGLVHLAGDPRVEADWESLLKNNITGTRNVFECARLNKIKKVVFASSNHVTAGYEGFPPSLHKQIKPKMIRVTDEIRPDSDYGVSKAFGETLARKYHELYKINFVCLRIGSVNEEDEPNDERRLKTWLSHRDLVQLIDKSLRAKIGFGIYYGVSDNKGRFWDIDNARKDLGYRPRDDASKVG